jgi:hypothetical protein
MGNSSRAIPQDYVGRWIKARTQSVPDGTGQVTIV